MAIREQRYITIRNKIITRTDVQKLAKLLSSIYKKKRVNEYDKFLRFYVKCDDGSSFSSSDVDIFEDDSPVVSKKALEISMSYQERSSEGRIEIDLRHSKYDTDYSNTIRVEGNDSNWVNGTLKKLDEIVETFSPQNMFFKKYGKVMGVVVLLLLGYPNARITNGIAGWSFPQLKPFGADNLSLTSFVIYALVSMVISLLWFVPLYNLWWKVSDFYPSIELQVAPEHKLVEKQKRQLFFNIILVLLIPVVLQIIFEIVSRSIK